MITKTKGMFHLSLDKGTEITLQIQPSNTPVSWQDFPEFVMTKLAEEIERLFDIKGFQKKLADAEAKAERARKELRAYEEAKAEKARGDAKPKTPKGPKTVWGQKKKDSDASK